MTEPSPSELDGKRVPTSFAGLSVGGLYATTGFEGANVCELRWTFLRRMVSPDSCDRLEETEKADASWEAPENVPASPDSALFKFSSIIEFEAPAMPATRFLPFRVRPTDSVAPAVELEFLV